MGRKMDVFILEIGFYRFPDFFVNVKADAKPRIQRFKIRTI
jgi:multisubunit Na+/H+ antiporter MnhG subunit